MIIREFQLGEKSGTRAIQTPASRICRTKPASAALISSNCYFLNNPAIAMLLIDCGNASNHLDYHPPTLKMMKFLFLPTLYTAFARSSIPSLLSFLQLSAFQLALPNATQHFTYLVDVDLLSTPAGLPKLPNLTTPGCQAWLNRLNSQGVL